MLMEGVLFNLGLIQRISDLSGNVSKQEANMLLDIVKHLLDANHVTLAVVARQNANK